MTNIELLEKTLPVAPLKIAALESCRELGQKVDDYIVSFRKDTINDLTSSARYMNYQKDSYLTECSCPRFGSGEAKGILGESIRGTDLYLMVDVCNYSLTYTVNGHLNHMSPDDHYQDLKRIISATNGKAHRLNVIMPFIYEGRQHKRTKRESLDCALALEELTEMGVSNIITFDAHDPRVQNSIPLKGFDSFNPAYQFIKALLKAEPDLKVDKDHLMIISPDEGAMHRAVYFSNVLGVDMGMFYKRRDYSTIINGKNPIVAHEFLGDDVTGKTVIIVDDMISSGESMLDVAKQLKDRHADRVIVCTTFGLFTDGLEKFDEYYEKGYISRVITTNLTYLPESVRNSPYFIIADLSKFIALIIDSMNHDVTIGKILSPTEKIHALLEKYNR
ncbi:phosphoribosylpyrophosphate synthetase [Mediterraneibacter butyricigenes]|uniref:ribose-phosphate diphosphokinase n=1 Tax=Mediterraneibacter butyricigenes TaxID=2316025 RepID=A0A391PH12_9FIRM|nr:ribose-phosphate pyrophosphokinase [Mediterraneibacter butyricigenes]RGO27913.1 ribose-phosphate pyrophosphokinase [Dorea sp. OM02-2LB]RGV95335.1 ribose-phosphate pyrophosphokinase [Ruminococcus sp. AF14-10]GCA65842.1 phosphoribosylpyrophosphate synthetase [Mediterraneibacter butyricigenes]